MKLGLRWKILTFTAVPLVILLVAALVMVHHEVSRRAHATIEDDLRRAAAVLENVWAARGHELAVAGQVITQDPKFFSVLTLPHGSEAQATVAGVARDFNALVEADLFEVLDANGRLLASVGRSAAEPQSRQRFAAPAFRGRAVSGVLVEPHAHYEVAVLPAFVGGRVAGALLLGSRIGRDLADQLRQLSRSEVTFLSRGLVTGSTLEALDDRAALIQAARTMSFAADREAFDGTLLPIGARSHHYLTLLRRMPQTDARDQQYYVLQRSLDAETAYLKDIQAGLLQMGSLAILVALVATFIIAERITRPVQSLVRAAEDLERGRYDTPIPVDVADEIGVLARRFQGMRERLHDYIRGLQEAGRLRSEFIGIASHELRTPISIIQGYFELLDRGDLGTLSSQQQMGVRGIGGSLHMLEGIAEAATRLAQIEGDTMSLEIQSCSIAGLIEQAVTRVTVDAKDRQVAIRSEIAEGVGEASVDGPRIVEALVNLVSNGVRFTPDEGWVRVSARRADGQVVIAVTDSGIGIAPEHHTAVLERGFGGRSSLNHHSSSRLEFNSSGLGLGLSIARGIVEAHGGTLSLKSALGSGSTFTIRLPIRDMTLRAAA